MFNVIQEIVGPRPSAIISELEKETQKYQEAHSMASESNLTLNKVLLAASLHIQSFEFFFSKVNVICFFYYDSEDMSTNKGKLQNSQTNNYELIVIEN